MPGRETTIASNIRQLIAQMALEHPIWGEAQVAAQAAVWYYVTHAYTAKHGTWMIVRQIVLRVAWASRVSMRLGAMVALTGPRIATVLSP